MPVDLSSTAHYALAMLPEIVLSVWAMFVLLLDVFPKGSGSEPSWSAIPWLTLVGVVIAGIATAWVAGLRETGAPGMIAVDTFRTFSNFLFLLAAALFILISTRYIDEERLRLGELYVLILFGTVGMMVFAG